MDGNAYSYQPVCPFFGWVKGNKMACEGATFRFADKSCWDELKRTYCYDMDGCKQCTLYKILMSYYERKELADNEQREAD